MDQLAEPAAARWTHDPVLSGLADGLREFTSSRKTYLATADPEALHRLRVALRRMRTALSIMKDHGDDARVAELAAQARRLFAATGRARESDVFAARIGRDIPENREAADMGKLREIVEAHRRQCHADARAFLAGARTQACMRNIKGFLANPRFDYAPGLRKVLGRLYKRARKRGRHFSHLTDDDRHELRISLKKLRYATGFFSDAFGRKRRYARLLSATVGLQDLLGAHNDLVAAGAFLENLPGADAPGLAQARRKVMEAYSRSDADAAGRLLRAWKKFKRAKPFWR